jgi:hypothetical protein
MAVRSGCRRIAASDRWRTVRRMPFGAAGCVAFYGEPGATHYKSGAHRFYRCPLFGLSYLRLNGAGPKHRIDTGIRRSRCWL